MADSRTPRVNEILRLQEDSTDADTIRLLREIGIQLGSAISESVRYSKAPSADKQAARDEAWSTLADLVLEVAVEE